MKQFFSSKYINVPNALIFIYCACVFTMVHYHEIWRDEAQKWLIVRDNDLIGVLKAAAYEGHPSLWTLLILPFAKLGWPVIWMQYLNCALMCVSVVIFVRSAPFSIILKTLFVLSYFMLYEYGIIARNYSILILLLFLIAQNHKDRFIHPWYTGILLLLMLQTHVLISGFVGGYALIYLMDSWKNQRKKQVYILSGIVLTGIILVFIQLKPPSDSLIIGNIVSSNSIGIYGMKLYDFVGKIFSIASFVPMNGIISILLLALLFYLFDVAWEYIIIYLSAFSTFFFVHTFYALHFWHTAMLFILAIVVIWLNIKESEHEEVVINDKRRNIGQVVICLLLVPSVYYNVRFYENDFRDQYTNSKMIAEKINQKYDLQKIKMVGAQSHCLSSILVYLPKKDMKFYAHSYRQWLSYIIWSKKIYTDYPLREDDFIALTKSKFKNDTSVVCIAEKQYFDVNRVRQQIYQLDSVIKPPFEKTDEDFYIFKLRQ